MELKPITWNIFRSGRMEDAQASVSIFRLHVWGSGDDYRWYIEYGDDCVLAEGTAKSIYRGQDACTKAVLEELANVLEPDDVRPASQPDHVDSGQDTGGDGRGDGHCKDCHKWLLECECGPGRTRIVGSYWGDS